MLEFLSNIPTKNLMGIIFLYVMMFVTMKIRLSWKDAFIDWALMMGLVTIIVLFVIYLGT